MKHFCWVMRQYGCWADIEIRKVVMNVRIKSAKTWVFVMEVCIRFVIILGLVEWCNGLWWRSNLGRIITDWGHKGGIGKRKCVFVNKLECLGRCAGIGAIDGSGRHRLRVCKWTMHISGEYRSTEVWTGYGVYKARHHDVMFSSRPKLYNLKEVSRN